MAEVETSTTNKPVKNLLLFLLVAFVVGWSLLNNDTVPNMRRPSLRISVATHLAEADGASNRKTLEKFSTNRTVSQETTDEPVKVEENQTHVLLKRRKKILLWGDLHHHHFGLGHEPFEMYCHDMLGMEDNCEYTNNRSLLEDADAVVFSTHSRFQLPLDRRKENQYWIFHAGEAPARVCSTESCKQGIRDLSGIFNWTNTYRHDADWRTYHGAVIPLEPGDLPPDSDFDYAAGKDRLVAWLVSHCNTSSHREDYVRTLQKYITVDIYGKCGPYKCPHNTKCLEMIEKRYKFYLSFENSLCRDYVTEKYFRMTKYKIVSIVMGGINGGDIYSRVGPKNSFINVFDFPSAKHLAEYLKFLDKNDDEYNKLHSWRRKYKNGWKFGWSHCALCEKLNDPLLKPKVYDNLYKWWLEDDKCVNGRWDSEGRWIGEQHGVKE